MHRSCTERKLAGPFLRTKDKDRDNDVDEDNLGQRNADVLLKLLAMEQKKVRKLEQLLNTVETECENIKDRYESEIEKLKKKEKKLLTKLAEKHQELSLANDKLKSFQFNQESKDKKLFKNQHNRMQSMQENILKDTNKEEIYRLREQLQMWKEKCRALNKKLSSAADENMVTIRTPELKGKVISLSF